jgi:hypothetical protein
VDHISLMDFRQNRGSYRIALLAPDVSGRSKDPKPQASQLALLALVAEDGQCGGRLLRHIGSELLRITFSASHYTVLAELRRRYVEYPHYYS